MKIKYGINPTPYVFKSLLVKFAGGLPLSSKEWNFLYQHQRILSNPHLDPVIHYYLNYKKNSLTDTHSFLLPFEKINKQNAKRLKKRLQALLKTRQSIQVQLSLDQTNDFKKATYGELILYHGNQFLTGAPFYPGGIPYVVFFQWGNLFGIAKYGILAEEKTLNSNVLIHFEVLRQKRLEQAVKEYQCQHPITKFFEHPHHQQMNQYTHTHLSSSPLKEPMPPKL